ncbi:MAG: hypothetical protein AAGA53_01320 [Pseudomonadota bacterium]
MIETDETDADALIEFDSVLLSALYTALEKRNLPVHPQQFAEAAVIVRSRAHWQQGTLLSALQPIFIQKKSDMSVLQEELVHILSGLRTLDQPEKPDALRSKDNSPETKPDDGFVESPHRTSLPKDSTKVDLDDPDRFEEKQPQQGALLFGLDLVQIGTILGPLILTLAAYSFFLQTGNGPVNPDPGPGGGADLISSAALVRLLFNGTIAATSLAGLIFLIWRAFNLQTADGRNVIQIGLRDTTRTPSQVKSDGSVFHVGSVGGRVHMLPWVKGRSIADMFGHYEGEPDPRRPDFERTMDQIANGEDGSQLFFKPRQELPFILLLVDETSEGLNWNTLDRELENVLRMRGLQTERIDYPGSFHKPDNGGQTLNIKGQLLESMTGFDERVVCFVFSEIQRFGLADFKLLRKITENGHLVFLDMRDRQSWSARHRALASTGVVVEEATARGLLKAVNTIFGPKNDQLAEDGHQDPNEVAIDFENWASDCALIEPVSFAMAEKFRSNYRSLYSDTPSLDFSRLAEIHNAWVGPDGIRFNPEKRRDLLNAFSRRTERERIKSWSILEKALQEAEPSIGEMSAHSAYRWIDARAKVFVDASDAAMSEIIEAESAGVLNSAPMTDFLNRLSWREADGTINAETTVNRDYSEQLILPTSPPSAQVRNTLANRVIGQNTETGTYSPETTSMGFARWETGTSLLRYHSKNEDFLNSALDCAFLPGARHLLISSDDGWELFDIYSLKSHRVRLDETSGALASILTSETSSIAVVCYDNRPPLLVRFDLEKDVAAYPENIDLGAYRGFPRGSGAQCLKGKYYYWENPDETVLRRIDVEALFDQAYPLPEVPEVAKIGTDLLSTEPSGTSYAVEPDIVEGLMQELFPDAKGENKEILASENHMMRLTNRNRIEVSYLLQNTESEGSRDDQRIELEPVFNHVVEEEPVALCLLEKGKDQPIPYVVAGFGNQTLQTMSSLGPSIPMNIGFVPRKILKLPGSPARTANGNGTGITVAVIGEMGEYGVFGFPEVPSENALAFAPVTLHEKLPEYQQALAVSGSNHRLAILAINPANDRRYVQLHPLNRISAPQISGTSDHDEDAGQEEPDLPDTQSETQEIPAA